MPFLVEHYIEHKEKKSNLSIWEFLILHYAQNSVKATDYEKDMKLPFKSHEGCTNFNIPVFTPVIFEGNLLKPDYPNNKKYHLLDELLFTSSYHPSIWQPPRIN